MGIEPSGRQAHSSLKIRPSLYQKIAIPGALLLTVASGIVGLLYQVNPVRAALPAPGGVDGVALWLKADGTGLIVNGSNQVQQWNDESGGSWIVNQARAASTHTSVAIPSNDILKIPNSANFNPSVDFSGATGKSLKGSASANWNSTADLNTFSVALPEGNSTSTPAGIFSTNGNWTGGTATGRGLLRYNTGPSYNLDGGGCGTTATVSSITGYHVIRGTYIAANNSLGGSTWLDGKQEKVGTACATGSDGSFFEIAGRTSQNFTSRIFNGKIPEVIVYRTALTATQAQQIESYLAIKYGTTQFAGVDYLVSDGTTKVWDATANATYKNNITGIGRDDNSTLNQKQSKSVNQGALVTIGNGNTIAADNASNPNNFTDDKDFLVFGDNNGAVAWTMTGAPTSRAKLSRAFKVQNTGSVGSVKVQVPRFTSSAATKLPAETVQVYLLTDADGDFSSGATSTPMTLNGTNFEANATLVDGTFFTFATETLPPPLITAATDSGASNTDGITNFTRPDFTGACAVGQTVTLTIDGTPITPTAICDGTGSYIITPNNPISDGDHIATAGLPTSGPYNFTIDTFNPAPGAPDLTTDTGLNNTDNITNDTTPTFTGTCLDDQTVTLQVDGTDVTPTAVCASGAYSITLDTALLDGDYAITATQGVDIAGNASGSSGALNITIDTTIPAAPVITGPAPGTHTINKTPQITGTGEVGLTITAREGGTDICTATVAPDGTWACSPVAPLADGLHTFIAIQTDPIGNVSLASNSTDITIETPAMSMGSSNNSLANTGTDIILIAGVAITSLTLGMYGLFRLRRVLHNG